MGADFLYATANIPKTWREDEVNNFDNVVALIDLNAAEEYVDENEIRGDGLFDMFMDDHPELDRDAGSDVFDELDREALLPYKERMFKEAVRDALKELAHDCRTYAEEDWHKDKDHNVLITGGMSWGDTPSESFDAICLIAQANLVPLPSVTFSPRTFNFPRGQDATQIATLDCGDHHFDVIVDEIGGIFEIRVLDSRHPGCFPVARCNWGGHAEYPQCEKD